MKNSRRVLDKKDVDCLLCVSSKDIDHLFDLSFLCCIDRLDFVDTFFIVTPDVKAVEKKMKSLGLGIEVLNRIVVIPDSHILSVDEQSMCGWSRQQMIKLRAHKLSAKPYILSVGADTIILKKLKRELFFIDGRPIIRIRRHASKDVHIAFERERCVSILRMLGIEATPNDSLVQDYIFDVFLFARETLAQLEVYLSEKFGLSYYLRIFPQTVAGYEDMKSVGEWSLYSIFVARVSHELFFTLDGTSFQHQIHTQRELDAYDYSNDAVHFVRKDFRRDQIVTKMSELGLLPRLSGKSLVNP